MINDKYSRIEAEAVIRALALLLDCISTYRLYDMGVQIDRVLKKYTRHTIGHVQNKVY